MFKIRAINKKERNRFVWILLGVLTVFLLRFASRHPQAVENVYGHFLYPGIRTVFRYTFGLLPFPAIAVVVLLALLHLYRTSIRPAFRREVTWRSFLTGLLATAGGLIFLFYALWGFNYARTGVVARMALDAPPLDSVMLSREFEIATAELDRHAFIHESTIRSLMQQKDNSRENDLALGVSHLITPLGYPDVPRPRGRLLGPKGVLLRFSTAGIYIPYSGEGHVDAGMLPVQIPFTMSHEIAHGYGVTDEGECNFVAYLACSASEDVFTRFSGLLSYWRYVASEYRRNFPDSYKTRFEELHPLIRETLIAIHENNSKYPDIMPRVRNAVYDTYLRSNGVEDGLISYSRMVRMVSAYRRSASQGVE